MEFNNLKLEDLATFKYGKMPNSKKKSIGGPYPIYTGYKISGYYPEYMYEDEMLIIVARGVGGTGDVKIAPPKCYITNLAIILELDKAKCDCKYMQLYLQSLNLRYLDSGSAQSQITINDLKRLKVSIPDLTSQQKIAKRISNIEEKITNNNNIIHTLEQLSQTLFKHWFIDFEFPNEEGKPYKSSGGEMVESELGEIPKRWRVGEIDSVGTIIGGGTPSKKHDEYYTDNGISWITPKDLSNDKNIFIYKGAIDITELGLKKGSARILQKDTVLFSSRAPIGYIAIAGKEVTTNQGFKSIVPDKGYSSYFIYHLLKFKLPVIEAAAGGSTFKEISGKGLKEIPVTLPTIELVNIYKEIVEPLFLQIQTLEKENKNLQQLRDTLLPKLLSGEIEIPDNLEV